MAAKTKNQTAVIALTTTALILAASGCKNNWVQEQSSAACAFAVNSSDKLVTITESALIDKIAQTFSMPEDTKMEDVELKLSLVLQAGQAFSANNSITIQILADDGSTTAPLDRDSRDVLADATIALGNLGKSGTATTPDFFKAALSRTITLEKNKVYWVVAFANYATDGKRLVKWAASATSVIATGSAFTSPTSTSAAQVWNANTSVGDMNFRFGCK